ncbi:MAG: glycosyltransferase family 39 protein [Pseudomonadota bacterium]|nr:glycosyltransferase family 39 protein [Pseudomonadota bacterium]
MSTQPVSVARSWLGGPLFSSPMIAMALIMLIGAFLRLYNLSDTPTNHYYLAGVKSMTQSWHNFFFVAAEPGGSVTIDKPPLGLWIQALSAFVFGATSFGVLFPQALAGILGLPVLYHLVRNSHGIPAGLLAALALAVSPIAVVIDRNNTMDAQLILVLLLAAWALLRSIETGRLRWLIGCVVWVGLGFNIKMLQAFLPLPAFYMVYLLGARHGLWRNALQIAAATLVLVTVSLSWSLVVDRTPAEQRPYIGSSENNRVMDTIVGYNGLLRLLGPRVGTEKVQTMPAGPPGGVPAGMPAGPQGMFREIGTSGPLRLFMLPLAKEAGWLLPLALAGLVLGLARERLRFPLTMGQQALLLWGGWLVTCLIFFSVAGFFHPYYLAMLTPPIAALVGIGFAHLWVFRDRWWGVALLGGAVGGTVVYQTYILGNYTLPLAWYLPGGLCLMVALPLLTGNLHRPNPKLPSVGAGMLAASLLFTPTLLSARSALMPSPNAIMPAVEVGTPKDGPPVDFGDMAPRPVDRKLLDYLQKHTQGSKYLLAMANSLVGAEYVIETGRPVLYLGGFNGSDTVVTPAQLQRLIDRDELRYILEMGLMPLPGEGGQQLQQLFRWAAQHCSEVKEIDLVYKMRDLVGPTMPLPNGMPGPGGPGAMPPAASKLYRCN